MTSNAGAEVALQDEEVLRFKIAAAARMLYRNGCDSGFAGTISMRVPGQEAFWSLALEFFDQALPEHTTKMGLDLKVLAGRSLVPNAMAINRVIYNERPDINAVVHLHSRYLCAISTRGETVGMFNLNSLMFFEDQVITEDGGQRMAQIDGRPAGFMNGKNAALMPYHGSINISTSLEIATSDAILYEEAARSHIDALNIGGTPVDNQDFIRNRLLRPHFRQIMWEKNMKRLERSDPDLFAHSTC